MKTYMRILIIMLIILISIILLGLAYMIYMDQYGLKLY